MTFACAIQAALIVAGLTLSIAPAGAQAVPDCGAEPVDSWVDAEWYDGLGDGGATEIAAALMIVVPPPTRPAAIAALANADIVAPTSALLAVLFPDGPPAAGGASLKPYLVRAVLANDNGYFYGHARGDTLWILNQALGCYSMSRAPLVVFLDRPPTILRVGVGAAL